MWGLDVAKLVGASPWLCIPHLNPGTTRVRIMKSLSEAPIAVYMWSPATSQPAKRKVRVNALVLLGTRQLHTRWHSEREIWCCPLRHPELVEWCSLSCYCSQRLKLPEKTFGAYAHCLSSVSVAEISFGSICAQRSGTFKGIYDMISLFFLDITIMKNHELGRNPVGVQEEAITCQAFILKVDPTEDSRLHVCR